MFFGLKIVIVGGIVPGIGSIGAKISQGFAFTTLTSVVPVITTNTKTKTKAKLTA